MKLIVREYLGSLRERGELDVILPDLLSQLGLNVFSRPARGTRQDGVDVAAVGKFDNDESRVFLFAIKPGDLTRRDWAGNKVQDLRPSLTEILDAYIPNRLPAEHRDKDIVICICIGGDVQEQVAPQISGFAKQHETANVTFQIWNGDKLAALIQERFLREDLLPSHSRSRLRKSLAMLDEPQTSFQHFAGLIRSLATIDEISHPKRVRAIRQMSICLWTLFAWCREANNVESAYLSGELTLVHAWKIVSQYAGKKTKTAQSVLVAFESILYAYQQISTEYLGKCVIPHAGIRDGVSSAVRSSSGLDVNIKLFDVLGRTAIKGLWAYWTAGRMADNKDEEQELFLDAYFECVTTVKSLISNNPILLLPVKDDQVIDISIAVLLLALDTNSKGDIQAWLSEMTGRARFAYETHGLYPCTLTNYSELLDHPQKGDEQYRTNVTQGSVLYPMIAFWAGLLNFDELYADVSKFKEECLEHCNFQFWYPDDTSEVRFYDNDDAHGATLSLLPVNRPMAEFVDHALGECENLPSFKELSATRFGFWPIIVVACRHYRLPVPVCLFEELRRPGEE